MLDFSPQKSIASNFSLQYTPESSIKVTGIKEMIIN